MIYRFFSVSYCFTGTSFSTDTLLALKHECHSKNTMWMKEYSQKAPTKHFKGFSRRFIELHTTFYADTLLYFASITDKTKYNDEKALMWKAVCVHSMVSAGRLMQEVCRSVTLASLFISFHRGSYSNNSP
jgi:hypothetical protein